MSASALFKGKSYFFSLFPTHTANISRKISKKKIHVEVLTFNFFLFLGVVMRDKKMSKVQKLKRRLSQSFGKLGKKRNKKEKNPVRYRFVQ